MSKYQGQQNQPPQGEVRDKVDQAQIVYRCIERVNMAGSSNENLNFEGAVDILFNNCPSEVINDVVKHVKEYRQTTDTWVYAYNCGHKIGTPEHPVRYPSGPLEGKLWSPILEKSEFVDYRVLFHVIMQTLQEHHVIWRTDNITMELGKVDVKEPEITLQSLEAAKLAISKIVDEDQKTGSTYTLYDILQRITPKIPNEKPTYNESITDEETDEEVEDMV